MGSEIGKEDEPSCAKYLTRKQFLHVIVAKGLKAGTLTALAYSTLTIHPEACQAASLSITAM